MSKKTYKYGFTLVEASGAMVILAVAMGLAVGGFMFALKKTNENDVQTELDIDVQLAMERLKKDLRLSSLDKIFYYPQGPGPYTAISFPLAEDSDGDGLVELDADDKIIWDKTLVYHIWPSSPNQLRVTTFNNRINSLTDTQRQLQLDLVVETGGGTDSSIPNHANASSHVVFENLLDWTIRPKQGTIDSYAPSAGRKTTSLGFALLSGGTHTFTFRVAGKNAASSDYKIGIDQLTVSPSYGEREAEAQLPVTAQCGATAVSQYMENGSWQGNHHLYFPATGVNQWLSLSMDNDRWEETNFGAVGYEVNDAKIAFDESLSPKDFIVQLKGNDVTWESSLQTDTLVGSASTNANLRNSMVAVHINGSELLTNGNWIAFNGKKCQLMFQAGTVGRLQIDNVRIGKTSSQETTAFAFSGSPTPVTFAGSFDSPIMSASATATSDWVNLEFNTSNNYVVAFVIKDDADKCVPMAWQNQRTSISDCLVNGNPTNKIFALKSIAASYPEKGTYSSQIFDTRLAGLKYGNISWNADIPAGTSLSFKVRTGEQPDLSDANAWSNICAFSSPCAVDVKRYVQFQTELTASYDGLSTPKLKDLTIDWPGELQMVNISGTFTTGPDYGVAEVLVDGVPLQAALSVDLLIYKNIYSLNKMAKKVTSSLVTDIRPRNTGK